VERALQGITLAEMSHPMPQRLVTLRGHQQPAAPAGASNA
jgi:hypothetical protein